MLILMIPAKRVLNFLVLLLTALLLAACSATAPLPIATVTPAPSLTPFVPSSTPTTIPSPAISFTATPDSCKFVQSQGKIQVMSQDLFTALEPGGPVDFDRILAEQNPAWADFRQQDHGEIRSAGVIFHETAFGPELGTGVNPAVILVTYGVERNWELPANGDLVADVDRIRATLRGYESEWIQQTVDPGQYPVANAATYALYRYFNGDLPTLEDWCRTYVQVYDESPLK